MRILRISWSFILMVDSILLTDFIVLYLNILLFNFWIIFLGTLTLFLYWIGKILGIEFKVINVRGSLLIRKYIWFIIFLVWLFLIKRFYFLAQIFHLCLLFSNLAGLWLIFNWFFILWMFMLLKIGTLNILNYVNWCFALICITLSIKIIGCLVFIFICWIVTSLELVAGFTKGTLAFNTFRLFKG